VKLDNLLVVQWEYVSEERLANGGEVTAGLSFGYENGEAGR
jgi:hypothetical protein